MKKFAITALLTALPLLAAERSVVIRIEGMTCPLCTTAVKRSLKKLPCVKKAKVKLSKKEAKVRFDDAACRPKTILEAVKKAGYRGCIAR